MYIEIRKMEDMYILDSPLMHKLTWIRIEGGPPAPKQVAYQ